MNIHTAAFTQVVSPEGCRVVFAGASMGPLDLEATVKQASQCLADFPSCRDSPANIIKVMLLGREVGQDVYMWRQEAYPSRKDYCDAVNADLRQVGSSSLLIKVGCCNGRITRMW